MSLCYILYGSPRVLRVYCVCDTGGASASSSLDVCRMARCLGFGSEVLNGEVCFWVVPRGLIEIDGPSSV